MLVIGLAGGVCSGKSVAAEFFRQQGAIVIDGDRLGHDVLEDAEVIGAAVDRWGKEVVDAKGQLVRSEIARRVFDSSPEGAVDLAFWEDCTHPRIRSRLKSLITQHRDEGCPVLVLDAAVMFKAGWNEECDEIVFVDAVPDVRLGRAKLRGWTQKQFESRESSQMGLAEKRRESTIVIDNSGTLEETYVQLQEFWNNLSV